MQSFSLMCRWYSSSFSLPSFLRWEEVSELINFEVPEKLEELLLSFSLDLPLELEELVDLLELELDEMGTKFLVWHKISDLHF